jgi:long-chain acyl-CoA synthetase
MSEVKTPWKDYMGDVPMHLDYFRGSMFEAVERMADMYPNNIAFDFMGKSTTYRKMVQEIEKCAKSLKTLGVRPGDKVTIAMPNCPQAIYMFYAVNLVGGIANMIHPLSAEKEIEFYLNASESTTAITLDQFYDKFEHIRQNTGIINIIIASVKDALSRTIRAGYMLTEGRKIQKIPEDAPVIRWKEFMDMSRYCFYKNYRVERGYDDPAVILYSGGTTGTTKGIVLTNGNFNALGQQIIATNPMFRPGDKMLAAMPLFHGFGLGVCVHSMLSQGGRCILIPRFTAKSYAKQIVKYKCNFIAGVPTLYEALLRLPSMDGADLSSLKGVFSGGDSLSIGHGYVQQDAPVDGQGHRAFSDVSGSPRLGAVRPYRHRPLLQFRGHLQSGLHQAQVRISPSDQLGHLLAVLHHRREKEIAVYQRGRHRDHARDAGAGTDHRRAAGGRLLLFQVRAAAGIPADTPGGAGKAHERGGTI